MGFAGVGPGETSMNGAQPYILGKAKPYKVEEVPSSLADGKSLKAATAYLKRITELEQDLEIVTVLNMTKDMWRATCIAHFRNHTILPTWDELDKATQTKLLQATEEFCKLYMVQKRA